MGETQYDPLSHETGLKKESITKAEVHMSSQIQSAKIVKVHEKSDSKQINYVPYDPRDAPHSIDSPKKQVSSNTGARQKTSIGYVPHVPADLERMTENTGRLEKNEVFQLPSVVVTRPDSSQMDVVYSKTIDSKHFVSNHGVDFLYDECCMVFILKGIKHSRHLRK